MEGLKYTPPPWGEGAYVISPWVVATLRPASLKLCHGLLLSLLRLRMQHRLSLLFCEPLLELCCLLGCDCTLSGCFGRQFSRVLPRPLHHLGEGTTKHTKQHWHSLHFYKATTKNHWLNNALQHPHSLTVPPCLIMRWQDRMAGSP